MNERRRIPRSRALKGAKIAFNHHHSVIDCVVRNLTDLGAMLKVPNTAGIPERFDFRLEHERTYRPARVIWRRDDTLGVEFA
jgi:hypothetical protein